MEVGDVRGGLGSKYARKSLPISPVTRAPRVRTSLTIDQECGGCTTLHRNSQICIIDGDKICQQDAFFIPPYTAKPGDRQTVRNRHQSFWGRISLCPIISGGTKPRWSEIRRLFRNGRLLSNCDNQNDLTKIIVTREVVHPAKIEAHQGSDNGYINQRIYQHQYPSRVKSYPLPQTLFCGDRWKCFLNGIRVRHQ